MLFQSDENYTGRKDVFVNLGDTIEGFKAIVNRDIDNIPEIMFSFKGTIDDVLKANHEANAQQ